MFNISIRKTGGLWIWNIGRIGGSFYVQSPAAFEKKLAQRCEQVAFVALATADYRV